MNSVENGPDTPQSAGAEGGNDTDDLDALLGSYQSKDNGQDDADKQSKPETQKTSQEGDIPDWARKMMDENEKFRREFRLERQRDDLSGAVKAIKATDPILSKLSDDWIKDRLLGRADVDPRLEMAFSKRHQNPGDWKKILKSFGKTMAKDLEEALNIKGSDPDDREAMLAASRNVSTKRAGDPDLEKLVSAASPQDFEEIKKKALSNSR